VGWGGLAVLAFADGKYLFGAISLAFAASWARDAVRNRRRARNASSDALRSS
jgi:hypothetical protein